MTLFLSAQGPCARWRPSSCLRAAHTAQRPSCTYPPTMPPARLPSPAPALSLLASCPLSPPSQACPRNPPHTLAVCVCVCVCVCVRACAQAGPVSHRKVSRMHKNVHACVRTCVRVGGRAGGRVGGRACMRACARTAHDQRMTKCPFCCWCRGHNFIRNQQGWEHAHERPACHHQHRRAAKLLSRRQGVLKKTIKSASDKNNSFACMSLPNVGLLYIC